MVMQFSRSSSYRSCLSNLGDINFNEVDENRDGSICKLEWTRFHDRVFTQLDANCDGCISKDEWNHYRQRDDIGGHWGTMFKTIDFAEMAVQDLSAPSAVITRARWNQFHDRMFVELDTNCDGTVR